MTRYREPPPKEEGAEGQGGGSGGEDGAEAGGAGVVQRKSLRERSSKKPSFASALATEAQGIQLHLDPRCTLPGYSGTGYKVLEPHHPHPHPQPQPHTHTHTHTPSTHPPATQRTAVPRSTDYSPTL